MRNRVGRIACCGALAAAGWSGVVASAQVKEAKADTWWFVDDVTPLNFSGLNGTGNYTLGQNIASITDTVYDPAQAPMVRPYREEGPISVLAELAQSNSTAKAESAMTVGARNADTGFWPWSVKLNAKTTASGFFTTEARATARGGDPQPITSPGVLESVLGLKSGSSMFVSDPASGDDSGADFSIGLSQILDTPLASVSIVSNAAGFDATVIFNDDSRAFFYDPASPSSPITEGEVEQRIEQSLLISSGGILSDMRLFGYRFLVDALPSGAEYVATGESRAHVTPEPTSLMLLLACASLARVRLREARD